MQRRCSATGFRGTPSERADLHRCSVSDPPKAGPIERSRHRPDRYRKEKPDPVAPLAAALAGAAPACNPHCCVAKQRAVSIILGQFGAIWPGGGTCKGRSEVTRVISQRAASNRKSSAVRRNQGDTAADSYVWAISEGNADRHVIAEGCTNRQGIRFCKQPVPPGICLLCGRIKCESLLSGRKSAAHGV